MQLLETRFAEYLDDRFLYYDQAKESCFRRELKIWWNHEKGESWRENNFSKLKERYRRRVDNFYKVFQEEKTARFSCMFLTRRPSCKWTRLTGYMRR